MSYAAGVRPRGSVMTRAIAAFEPAYPPRRATPLPIWRMFTPKYATNMLLGWDEASFDDLYRYRRIITLPYHVIAEPDAIGRIFLDNVDNYPKPPLVLRMLSPVLRESLFTAHGADWKDQRRLMAPIFTPHAVAEFAPIFADVARASADRWAGADRIDVSEEATRATFEVISRALFSGDRALASDEAGEHILAVLTALGEYRLGVIFGMPWLDRSKVARRGRVGQRYLQNELTAFIQRRQADPTPPQDFMTRLIDAFSAQHPPDRAAALILDNALLFFVAGHETTSNALTWSLYCLGGDPDVQERAAGEAQAALAAGLSPAETVARLPYVRQVLEEAMRLYPSVPRIDRIALAADELAGHHIRKGDMVSVWPWQVHRHRRLWRNPDRFDPENFSPEAKAQHHRFQYLPFGAGPRVCIGATFALSEGVLILSEWLARYRFRLDADQVVEPAASITTRPKGGLPMRIEPRERLGRRAP